MTQTELFNFRQAGNLTVIEPGLAAGIKTVLPPFARNSETSRQAAIEKYSSGNAPCQREMIYRLIRFAGDKGQIREEIAEKLDLSGDTVRPRIKELLGEAKGWPDPFIRRNGQTRKTKSGLNAEVLVVV